MSALVRRHPDIMVREETEGRYLVLNRKDGGVFVASNSAAMILNMASEPVTREQVIEKFLQVFVGVSEQEITADVTMAIDGMVAGGLLETVNETPSEA